MTTLQQILSSQASPEITINENLETLSAYAMYGKRPSATSGLVFGYYGGFWAGATIADGTLTLAGSATNYVVVAVATGAITVATTTTNWNDAVNYLKCYRVVTGVATMTTIEDWRMGPGGLGSFTNALKQDLLVSGTNIKTINSTSLLGFGNIVISGGGGGKTLITATQNYYVRTDGSDSNDGLANTSGGAFLTIQKAVDVVCTTLDMTNFGAVINVADGTYTGAVKLKPYVGAVAPIIIGSGTLAGLCIINPTAADCFNLSSSTPCTWVLEGMRCKTTTSGNGVYCSGRGNRIHCSKMVWDACPGSVHVYAFYGGYIQYSGPMWLAGAAAYHMYAFSESTINVQSANLGLQANLTFTTYAYAQYHSAILNTGAYTPSGAFTITGKRYDILSNSAVTGNASTKYFPGTVVGTLGTQCFYNA